MVDLRKLKDEASEAAGKASWKKAAGLYSTLEQHERNGLWPPTSVESQFKHRPIRTSAKKPPRTQRARGDSPSREKPSAR